MKKRPIEGRFGKERTHSEDYLILPFFGVITASLFRPAFLRREITFFPLWDDILALKPCFLLRFKFFILFNLIFCLLNRLENLFYLNSLSSKI